VNVLTVVACTLGQEIEGELHGHHLPEPEISAWGTAVAVLVGLAMLLHALRGWWRR
jgi:hypothetical protein